MKWYLKFSTIESNMMVRAGLCAREVWKMKKKMAALMMAAAVVMMTAIPTMAGTSVPSPSNVPVTEAPKPASPKTGESDALLYGVGAAAVCGTVIVISGRKLKKS